MRSNPARSALPDAERPKSSSTVSMCVKPNRWSRSRIAQAQVERGIEIQRYARLNERRADGPEIVSQPDAGALAKAKRGVAVGIEFAEQPGAETAGIEESHHGRVVLPWVSAVGEKLLALCICEEFHFMRPLGRGWLAGNAGLWSVTSAGAAGVVTAIRESGMASGTADAHVREPELCAGDLLRRGGAHPRNGVVDV